MRLPAANAGIAASVVELVYLDIESFAFGVPNAVGGPTGAVMDESDDLIREGVDHDFVAIKSGPPVLGPVRLAPFGWVSLHGEPIVSPQLFADPVDTFRAGTGHQDGFRVASR